MTLFQIVGLYVALNIVLLITLSYRVVAIRGSEKVSLGDGGNEVLRRRIRAQANLTEYAPLAMIGLLLLAGLNAGALWLHGLGGAFTLGRYMHAFGLSSTSGDSKARFFGMILTWGSMLVMAGYLLFKVFD